MARTITEIYDAMAAEKASLATLSALQPDLDTSQQLLDDLATPSRVARWRLLLWVCAFAIWVHETLFDAHRAEVDALILAKEPGTTRWYADVAKRFQYGYDLAWDGTKYVYATNDEAARIVQRSACIESPGTLKTLIKVAKLDGDGLPTPLATAELEAFEAYIDQVKVAGTDTQVLSLEADRLRIRYTVYYDPLVLDATGGLLVDAAVRPVDEAITAYIQDLPFNGTLVLSKLTDAVQNAQGVDDPVLTLAEATYGTLPFAPIADRYVARAGHMAIDPAFPLETEITYLPAT